MSAPYACVRDLIYELKGNPGNTNVPDVVNGLRFLKQATERVERKLKIRFQPFYETHQFDPLSWDIDSTTLQITTPETLFSLTDVYDGNGTLLDPSLYFVFPVGALPFRTVELVGRPGVNPFGGSMLTWYQIVCPPYLGASNAKLNGVWGWHNDYANAWTDSLDTVQSDPMLISDKFVIVSDASASDIYGRTPRFSPGQLFQIDQEMLEFVSVDGVDPNKLYVLRAQNGTDAAQHLIDTEILIWDTPWDVQQAVTRFAAYPYKRRGDYAGAFESALGKVITLPADLPGDVMGILQDYSNGVP